MKYKEIEEREKAKGPEERKPIKVPKTDAPFGKGEEGERKMADFNERIKIMREMYGKETADADEGDQAQED